MIYVFAFVAVIILLLVYMRFEAGFAEVKKVKFSKSGKSLKILHLSDIHIGLLKVPVKKVTDVVRAEKPDLIILTGDYVEKSSQAGAFIEFLESIKTGIPTYLCLGNHDYIAFSDDSKGFGDFIREIESTGARVLINDAVCFEKNSRKYNIIGIDDLKQGAPDLTKAMKNCCADAFMNIGITHNPDIVLEVRKGIVDYLFCGHFHGGQIRVPFDIESKCIRKDKLTRMGIRGGLHKLNGIIVYINRGLGNVIFPLRFLARPEITVYYLP